MAYDFEAIGELFAAEAVWIGDGRTRTRLAGVEIEVDNPLEVSPLESSGRVTWPEQVFPAALAACMITTLTSINKKMRVPIEGLRVRVKPILGLDEDGGFKFERMIITVTIRVGREHHAKAERLVQLAHKYCLISKAIKGNVEEEIRTVFEPTTS
ncbi:MAG: OsmC family protein [Desulfurococcales archaeon]|nr:OsmC family protein [Desulfurococcales archaeon]